LFLDLQMLSLSSTVSKFKFTYTGQ